MGSKIEFKNRSYIIGVDLANGDDVCIVNGEVVSRRENNMKVVKLLKVECDSYMGFRYSYHEMEETEKQYRAVNTCYKWIVPKSIIGKVQRNSEVYVVVDESDSEQVFNTAEFLLRYVVYGNKMKMQNMQLQNDRLTEEYDKFVGSLI